jgi:hypothetical protein
MGAGWSWKVGVGSREAPSESEAGSVRSTGKTNGTRESVSQTLLPLSPRGRDGTWLLEQDGALGSGSGTELDNGEPYIR